MICLGIESTAHTFGVGIIKENKILANVKQSYTTKKGGMIPSKASEHHLEAFEKIIREALYEAGIGLNEVDLIAFSQGPGIGHTLRIGANAARSLSLLFDKPIIGVNHCIAHLEIGRMFFDVKNPLLVYLSGANTQIIAYSNGKYRIFGETLDIGVGNFVDSLARELGLGFPGGPELQKLAEKGDKYINLPYAVKGMDVSFGGLLTNLKHKIKSGEFKRENIAYSAQETIFAMLMEVTERAMAHCKINEIILGGGVACNKRLQEMTKIMTKERGAKCHIPPQALLVDNGAMIAWLGHLIYNSGISTNIKNSYILPYQRTDDIIASWAH
ncbi:MAG: bifunctional N(6)-L-threonylcarbamoyladenine synthase/serine/threonine protein kinase [Candidatus Nanoarchaeia archaeon]